MTKIKKGILLIGGAVVSGAVIKKFIESRKDSKKPEQPVIPKKREYVTIPIPEPSVVKKEEKPENMHKNYEMKVEEFFLSSPDIVFRTKSSAQAVIDELKDIVTAHGIVLIEDLYKSAGKDIPEGVAGHWLPKHIDAAEIVSIASKKYAIRLPKPM